MGWISWVVSVVYRIIRVVLVVSVSVLVLPFALLHAIFYRYGSKKRNANAFRRKVAVVGGGIAGCSAAWALKRSGFDVVIYEARGQLGGNAKTFTWNIEGRPTTGLSVLAWPPEYFRNYRNLLIELGIKWEQVELPFFLNFLDKGKHNVFSHLGDTDFRKRFAKDLIRWKQLVQFVRKMNDLFSRSTAISLYKMSLLNFLNIIPLRLLLKFFGISDSFWHFVVVPVYSSSFLSTNLTFIPAVIVPSLDDLIPLDKTPQMHSWATNSSEVFRLMTKNIGVFLNQPVSAVNRISDTEIQVISKDGTSEKYQSVIFACPAETVLKCLQKPTLLEYTLLNGVSYVESTDTSFLEGLIHSDTSVFPSEFQNELLSSYSNYIEITRKPNSHKYTYENTFIISSWLPLFKSKKYKHPLLVTYNSQKEVKNPVGTVSNALAHPDLCFRNLAISFLMKYAQGYKNTYFCGSYVTPGNGHDLSLLSGFAVAKALGGEYPFPEDKDAADDFRRLCGIMGL